VSEADIQASAAATRRAESPVDVSVVIPALNEAETIGAALRSAIKAFGETVDLIVADGGSSDDTVERASKLARVVTAPRGRGAQLNAGARLARGRVFVFLHADTTLDPLAGGRILEASNDPGTVGGCCRFAVEPSPEWGIRYRLLERGVNLRTRVFRTATGDQAIFSTRWAFERVGGFPEEPLFEDVGFVRSLRRLGRFQLVDAVALTSDRRWRGRGFVRTVVSHWLLRAAYTARVPPRTLARWYERPRLGRAATPPR
jgi:rSAM/selenodomain-associated transferase 2